MREIIRRGNRAVYEHDGMYDLTIGPTELIFHWTADDLIAYALWERGTSVLDEAILSHFGADRVAVYILEHL